LAVDLSVLAGMKFGLGFAIGASLVALLLWEVVSIAVDMGITRWPT
jgi:hypothetical protein